MYQEQEVRQKKTCKPYLVGLRITKDARWQPQRIARLARRSSKPQKGANKYEERCPPAAASRWWPALHGARAVWPGTPRAWPRCPRARPSSPQTAPPWASTHGRIYFFCFFFFIFIYLFFIFCIFLNFPFLRPAGDRVLLHGHGMDDCVLEQPRYTVHCPMANMCS